MTTGLIIGWLIGQLFITIILNGKNARPAPHASELLQIARQTTVNVCTILSWTAGLGLIGAVIGLLL